MYNRMEQMAFDVAFFALLALPMALIALEFHRYYGTSFEVCLLIAFFGTLLMCMLTEMLGGVPLELEQPAHIYRAFGRPDVFWPLIGLPGAFVLPPQAFTFNEVQYVYYLAVGAEKATVARRSGGDHYSHYRMMREVEDVQEYAAIRFGSEAREANIVWRQKQAEAQRAAQVEREAASARSTALDAQMRAQQEQWDAENHKREAAKLKVAQPIPLAPAGVTAGIVFGTEIEMGDDVIVPVTSMQHTLIAGVSGSGKSVFIHQLLSQLVRAPQVERMYLVDMKGGLELNRFNGEKTQVIWRFADVVAVVDELVVLMEARQDEMRERGLLNWPGGRTFLVIDEYAEIQSDIDAASTPDEKRVAKRLSGNLVRIARRARALGIVLVCALQKPTTDAMDSALRNNLSCRICLRVATRALASSMLDDLDELPVDPVKLRTGRFIYYDASQGVKRYAQAHVAPGIRL